MEIIIPYLHYLGIMALMGALITEHIMLKPGMRPAEIKSLTVTDLIYGISAIIVLATGLLRWFVYGKGSEFYLSNPVFHTKLTLFVIIAVLSVFPTIKFLKWRKMLKEDPGFSPDAGMIKKQLMFLRIELLLVAIIPLLAVLMTRGYGI